MNVDITGEHLAVPPGRHFSNVWTIGSVCSLLASLGSLLAIVVGGIWFAARLDLSTKEIPELIRAKNEQAKEIAVLQDQQRYTDSRYAEIMLQLARINAKLDQQNEYLYNDLPHNTKR